MYVINTGRSHLSPETREDLSEIFWKRYFILKVFGGWLTFMMGMAILAFLYSFISGTYFKEFENGSKLIGCVTALIIMFVAGLLFAVSLKLFFLPNKIKKEIAEGDFGIYGGVITYISRTRGKTTVRVNGKYCHFLTSEDCLSASEGDSITILVTKHGNFATKSI